MNRLTQLFFVLFLLCLPVSVMAQKDKNDDSKYLAGAVPEVDGKVVFSKEFNIPGMSQDEIFDRMMKWMETRLKENKNQGSRVAYSDKEKGIIAGVGEEWIVFKSSALSLDRTWVNYQITVTCKPEKCFMEVEKIRFTYGENEKYTAEDWISDKYALNKAKTKLIRGLAKWRRKTVDFADNLFTGAAQALGAAGVATEPVIQPGKQAVITPGPVVITPANPVIATDPSVNNNPSAANVPGYKEITPDQIPANAIQMGAGNLVVAIGKDAFNMTMMTANAGGSLGKMNGKPVVVRTLDIGGDKEIEAIDLPKEMNPFLGVRAVRLCFQREDIFRVQLRALLRASVYGDLRIMFPMIATLDEFRKAKGILLEEKEKLVNEGIAVSDNFQVGIMIEIPAAAVLADQFAKEVDFFSIGTNDLVQYTFAADRMSSGVSYLYQPFHPSILRLIKHVIESSHKEGKWTGMCGEMAGEAIAAPLLIGLGLDEFSMSATSILSQRKLIRSMKKSEMNELAAKAINCGTMEEVVALVKEAVEI